MSEGEAKVMRKYHGGVNDGGVNQFQGPEVIFNAVADQDCLSTNETHQIHLNLPKGLAMASVINIFGSDSGESCVVVNNRIFWMNQLIIDFSPFYVHHSHSGKLHANFGEDHLTVQSVDGGVEVTESVDSWICPKITS